MDGVETPLAGRGGYRALVVDDEVPPSYLDREHFELTRADAGVAALSQNREAYTDVVILALALTGIDGVEVRRRRRTVSDAYLVMLTARDTELDIVLGLPVVSSRRQLMSSGQ